jgi:hypothetical protein
MTRGKGIYDDEEGSAASEPEKDPDRDTPDVDKDTEEPTA